MKTGKYEVNGWIKYTEEDNFEKGCIGKTQQADGNDQFSSDTVQGVIDLVSGFVGNNDKESILLNSCDEVGRLDIQVTEDENGMPAIPAQIEDWKIGQCRLWLACYSFQVQEVERKDVDLITAMK